MVEDSFASQNRGELLPITKEWLDLSGIVTNFGSNIVSTHRRSMRPYVKVAESFHHLVSAIRERDRPEFFLRDLSSFSSLPLDTYAGQIPWAAVIYGITDPGALASLALDAEDIRSGELIGEGTKRFNRDTESGNSFNVTFRSGLDLTISQRPGGEIAAKVERLDDIGVPYLFSRSYYFTR